jgi:hypothetical protein
MLAFMLLFILGGPALGAVWDVICEVFWDYVGGWIERCTD